MQLKSTRLPRSTRVPRICGTCGKTFAVTPSALKNGEGHFCDIDCYNSSKKRPVEVRFWECVERTETCWLWRGTIDAKGYGTFFHTGKSHLAHRVAWELCRGEIPEGLLVCHNCPGPQGDQPLCVNPNHLFLGTYRDNTQDAIRKGTMSIGERNANSRLTAQDVKDIRAAYATGQTAGRLAAIYHVHRHTIWMIVRGKSWSHVP